MIFGLILLVLILGVVAIHYIQGMFSAMISCVLAIFAALLAISYHEVVAEKMFLSQMPNQAHAVALVGLFALSYVFMRLATDKLIPGNVRVPVLADKIGSAVFGGIAGIFGAGILAVAAQMLPFGPSVMGFSRFPLADRTVQGVRVPGRSQMQDLQINDELQSDTLDSAKAASVIPLPVDDLTLGLAYYVSNNGSLAGDRSLASAHPDYLTELFGERLSVFSNPRIASSPDMLQASKAYTAPNVFQSVEDFELKEVRGDRVPTAPPMDNMVPLMVRVAITGGGAPAPMSFSSIDLVLGKSKADGHSTQLNPIGSLQQGARMLLVRPDDPVNMSGQTVDLVFVVPADSLVPGDVPNQKKLPEGTFLQTKRTARVDLSGKVVEDGVPGDSSRVGIKEKTR